MHCILLAHGSPNTNWCNTFEQGLAAMEGELKLPTSLAYMEMTEPSLETVIAQHYHQGNKEFIVVPLFFAAGKHLIVDVPQKIDALLKQLPGTSIELKIPIGEQDAFWQLLSRLLNSEVYSK